MVHDTSLAITGKSILEDALRLRELPVSVIPVALNKKPPSRFSWKRFQSEIATESEIRDWFDGRDDLGLAIVLGMVSSDLYARDFDSVESYEAWATSHKALAKSLPTVITSRGRHVYARCDNVKTQTFDDGELRSNGGYAVAPHSRHLSGDIYRWHIPIKSLAKIPIIHPTDAGLIRPRGNDTDRNRIDSVRSVSICVTDLIAGTIPPAFGTRRGRLFELARRVRSHPTWGKVPLAQLRPILVEWHKQALPTIRTKEFEESWIDFFEAYQNVDVARCGDATVFAMEQAELNPLPTIALKYTSDVIRKLVALCFYLSFGSKDGVFFLSCRKAAAVLHVDEHKSTARWLKMLCADRVIIEVEKGGPHSNRATRFKWIGGIES